MKKNNKEEKMKQALIAQNGLDAFDAAKGISQDILSVEVALAAIRKKIDAVINKYYAEFDMIRK
jgi:hypothetical protein